MGRENIMAQAAIAAVAAIVIVLLGINYAEGNFCWSQLCQENWQANIKARSTRATWTDTAPRHADGLADAGYRRHHEQPSVEYRPVPPPQGSPRVQGRVVQEFSTGQEYCNKYMGGLPFKGWTGSGPGRRALCNNLPD